MSGNVVEIQGIAGISVTDLRSQGFKDALAAAVQGRIKIVASNLQTSCPTRAWR